MLLFHILPTMCVTLTLGLYGYGLFPTLRPWVSCPMTPIQYRIRLGYVLAAWHVHHGTSHLVENSDSLEYTLSWQGVKRALFSLSKIHPCQILKCIFQAIWEIRVPHWSYQFLNSFCVQSSLIWIIFLDCFTFFSLGFFHFIQFCRQIYLRWISCGLSSLDV